MDAVILFATLFLGLVDGERDITLDVADGVAAVEVLLDQEVVARLDGAPWTTRVDFGPGFLPGLLEARALDAEGEVLGTARQWINLPPPPAEVQVMLESDEQGNRRARASWLSTSGSDPVRAQVFLDGAPLDAPDLSDIPLPRSDGRAVRVLRIDLEFPGDLSVSREVLFGGVFVDSIDSELSAIAVETAESARFPEVVPALAASSEELRAVAVEDGPIDLFVVRDERAAPELARLAEIEKRRLERNRSLTNVDVYGQLARLVPLDRRTSLRFIWPFRAPDADDDFQLFPRSQEWTAGNGGLFFATTLLQMPEALSASGSRQALAEAVTVAGMAATRRNRRRAVLLLLSSEGLTERSPTIRHAREYLRAVGVPLVIWTPSRGGLESGADSALESWGPAVDISSTSRFRQAGRELWERLDRQRVVWFEGRRLPQHIAVTTPGLRVAGRAP